MDWGHHAPGDQLRPHDHVRRLLPDAAATRLLTWTCYTSEALLHLLHAKQNKKQRMYAWNTGRGQQQCRDTADSHPTVRLAAHAFRNALQQSTRLGGSVPVMSSARPAIFFCLIISTTTPHASRACSCPTKPTPQAKDSGRIRSGSRLFNLLGIPLPWAVCPLLQLAHHSFEIYAVSATLCDILKL